MELTHEESVRQALIIKQIQDLFLTIDANYLEESYRQMQSALSFRQSAMILNPRPMTAMEQGDLEGAKLKQLRLYIDAAKNIMNIMEAETALAKARSNENNLWKMFNP